MKFYSLPGTELRLSRLAYGCMSLARWDDSPLTEDERRQAIELVCAAYEAGINLFDHADIYGYGKAEEAFSAVWSELKREDVVLQSKCGIILPGDPRYEGPGRYDFSYDHILQSVRGSLERLQTDYLDILLLHRPDALMQPEEVARAFGELEERGWVRHFGVSNHTVGQMALLQDYVAQPILVNQLELSLLHAHLVDEGIVANRDVGSHALATGILDYCRKEKMLIQAYSPVAGGRLFRPGRDDPQNVKDVARHIEQMAGEKGTTREAVALAWLLRHPAGIQPVFGTTRAERIRASARADQVELSREEWYRLFVAARGGPVP